MINNKTSIKTSELKHIIQVADLEKDNGGRGYNRVQGNVLP